MGNSSLQSIKTIPFQLQESSLKQTGIIKLDGKTHIIYRENRTKSLYLQYNLPFENDVDLKNLHKTLLELKKMSLTKILRVHCVNVEDRRISCSSSNFKLYVDYHEKTLEDILEENRTATFFDAEHKIWCFLFSMMEILSHFFEHKIDCNFVHTRSIFYNPSIEGFGMIHPAFFKDNNFTEALAGNLHFCSPELYHQILSKNRKFLIAETDKSNSFSLGLILLKALYSHDPTQFEDIYDKELISVNSNKIKSLVQFLPKRGFSQLLMRILLDMTREFEHVRLSPTNFMKVLKDHRLNLETNTFNDHDELLPIFEKFG